jgi:outer membrane murein-binding lipoprotein Lpp
MTKKYMTLPAMVAGALGMGATGSAAWAAEPTTDELMRQIEQLQSKVQQLENKQEQQLSAKDVDATVDRVLRDAERRSQLMQMEGFTAGYDNGFKLRSADGNFLLNPYFQFQFRNTTNFTDGRAVFDADDDIIGFDDDEDVQNGFEVRRAKFGFRGNAFTPDLTYNFRWETDESGGGVTLEEATVQYQFADDMAVRIGQWKDDWTHEETVSSSRQLAADRSLLNELLGGGQTDYVQGIMLVFNPQDSAWRASVAYHDGANTDNTDWQENTGGIAAVGGPNFGVSGRVDYKFSGDWRSYDDFTAMNNNDNLFVVGAGVDFTQGGDNDIWFHTVDVQWENTNGLALYGAYVASWADTDPDDVYNWGALGQVGYMFNETTEVFGRVDYTQFDFDTASGDDDFAEATVGMNYYWRGHAAKFTVDITWLFNGSPTDVTGIGVLAGDDDQFVIRGQFQLLI